MGHRESLGKAATLRLDFPAVPGEVAPARRAVCDYAARAGVVDVPAVALAISEAITNAVVHAYPDAGSGRVTVTAERPADEGLVVIVEDSGDGLKPRSDSPGMGLGLALIAQLAQTFKVSSPAGGGTHVCMSFAVTGAA